MNHLLVFWMEERIIYFPRSMVAKQTVETGRQNRSKPAKKQPLQRLQKPLQRAQKMLKDGFSSFVQSFRPWQSAGGAQTQHDLKTQLPSPDRVTLAYLMSTCCGFGAGMITTGKTQFLKRCRDGQHPANPKLPASLFSTTKKRS